MTLKRGIKMCVLVTSVIWTKTLHLCCRLHDAFRNTDPSALESEELASDGIIMDLTYSLDRYRTRNMFPFVSEKRKSRKSRKPENLKAVVLFSNRPG